MTFTKRLAVGVGIATLMLAPEGAWAAGANAVADTYISATSPASNFGVGTAVNVGGGNSALIQFDLSALPAGLTASNINKATMTFYVNAAAIPGSVDLAQVTSAWTETGVTNNNRPTYLSPFAFGVPIASRQYVTVDVTQLVKDWVTGVASNFGVQISAAAAAPATAIVLDSKENQTTSHPAFMDVTIQSVGPQGPPGQQGIQGVQGIQGIQGVQGIQGPAGSATGTIFSAQLVNNASTSALFTGLTGGNLINQANFDYVATPMPVACTFDHLIAVGTISANATPDTVTVTMALNGSPMGMHVDVPVSTQDVHVTASTAANSFSVIPGDRVAFQITQTDGTPTVRLAISATCK